MILIDPDLNQVCETFVGTATHMSPERVMGEVGGDVFGVTGVAWKTHKF